jgi:hypothetical protein
MSVFDGWQIMLGLAVNGFFTGLGVVSANYFYDRLIRPRLDKLHNKIGGITNESMPIRESK